MSATSVLVPVLESEAEALFEGGARADSARRALTDRAGPLRARVARIDAIREELHAILFDRWNLAVEKKPSAFTRVLRRLSNARPPPPPPVDGYDPFVHLFGRSLPIDAPNPRAVAARLEKIVTLDDAAFERELALDLRGLDGRAAELLLKTPAEARPEALEPAIDGAIASIAAAFEASPPRLRDALGAVARLSAWSWPVWRLDGELLPELLQKLGTELEATGPGELFEGVLGDRPDAEALVAAVPSGLEDFGGAGLFLSSSDVKLVAGALRLQRGRITENLRRSAEQAIAFRHARLLEEAVTFCESRGLALCEAAGVEWHDRARAPSR